MKLIGFRSGNAAEFYNGDKKTQNKTKGYVYVPQRPSELNFRSDGMR